MFFFYHEFAAPQNDDLLQTLHNVYKTYYLCNPNNIQLHITLINEIFGNINFELFFFFILISFTL